jgi:hypothetical protein
MGGSGKSHDVFRKHPRTLKHQRIPPYFQLTEFRLNLIQAFQGNDP